MKSIGYPGDAIGFEGEDTQEPSNAVCECGCGEDAEFHEEEGDPRDFVVDARVQILIHAVSATFARIEVKERLNEVIAQSDYPLDPMNGAVILAITEAI